MLFNDEKTVFDLDRCSWSADIRFEPPRARLVVMYGAGKVNDDYFYVEQEDLKYSGYEARFLVWLMRNRLQIGARYDTYIREFLKSGNLPDENNLTFGINLIPTRDMRLQLNYMIKRTEDDIEPDLDDNILFLNLEYAFNVAVTEGSKKTNR